MAEKRTYKAKTVRVCDSVAVQADDFGNIVDFKVEVPIVKENALVVGSNYEEISKAVRAIVDKYGKVQLTEDNLAYVKTLKSHFVSLRTSIERERKDWVKIYLDPAKKTVQAMCDDLLKIVAEGENALGKQLDEYDQKRKDELTEVLNAYKDDAVKKHNLRPEYAEQLVIKDKYYNKTQAEEDSADDIEAQAVELEKKQTEWDSSVALIKAECEGSTLVVENYIDQLKYRSAMEIVLKIKSDKKEAQRLYEELKAKEDAGEKIEIGKPVTEEVKAMFSAPDVSEATKAKGKKDGGLRTRKLIIKYRPEVADDILEFFADKGIQYEFIKY